MKFFPLFARLNGRPCLVVGGGTVAHRKTLQLLRAGAAVTVNAPALNAPLAALADAGQIEFVAGPFAPELIDRHVLSIAATSDAAVNEAVAEAARQAERLCNVVDDGPRSAFIMPSVLDRNPLLIAVSSGGESPVLARMIRQQIEAWLPSGIGTLARWAGGWRKRVNTALDSYEQRLRLWERIIDGPAAGHVLAGRSTRADELVERALAESTDAPVTGEGWIVGAGPGDPDLITRRGLTLLNRADVVLYDRLVAPSLLAAARRDAELISVGKSPGGPSVSQDHINEQLVALVRAGHRVCRLKGGDPFVFGRGGEEIAALAEAGLPYQVVPGITAASGCAAYAGIPLTHRELADSVTLVTASRADDQDPTDWATLGAGRQTLVIYMGVRHLAAISEALIRHGRAEDTPAAIVMQGTTSAQQVVGGRLDRIHEHARAAGIAAPAVLIVGAVAELSTALGWFGGNAAPDQAGQTIDPLSTSG